MNNFREWTTEALTVIACNPRNARAPAAQAEIDRRKRLVQL